MDCFYQNEVEIQVSVSDDNSQYYFRDIKNDEKVPDGLGVVWLAVPAPPFLISHSQHLKSD